MKFWNRNKYLFLFVIVVLIFFYPMIFYGKIPIAADSLVGLYHPFRDQLVSQYPNGYPFKNPLITDPFRQQYPYRLQAITALKNGELPKWNPYNFSGTPLFANIQSATLYPLNFLFWIFSDMTAWSVLIMLQPLLAGIFMFFYLRFLKLNERACFLGSVSFAFSGFMIAWLEWNTLGHVALWLPLILLAKDHLINKFTWSWAMVMIFAESSMILAGHLQTAFYIIVFTTFHIGARSWWISNRSLTKTVKKLLPFLFTGSIVVFITSFQLIPTAHFILESARNVDLASWQRADWFLPPMHLLQFLAPDFFGNPATGNYWGVWNYGEFVGYIGLIPFILAIVAIFFRKDAKTRYFTAVLIISLLFALPTPLGKLPYQLNIPFLSTLQPSRILIFICFSFSVLSAYGFDCVLEKRRSAQLQILSGLGLLFLAMWVVVLFKQHLSVGFELSGYLDIAKHNLIIPTIVFFLGSVHLWFLKQTTSKNKTELIVLSLLALISLDLLRFGSKFTPFVDSELLFPKTKIITLLKEQLGDNRFMTTDRRIMPPNIATFYKLQSVDGYDPLYLKLYSELVSAWTRDRADIIPGAFNRILTPEDPDSFLADLLGVKYVLSFEDEPNPKLKLVYQEGETRVFENTQAFPRAFLVAEITGNLTKKEIVDQLFIQKNHLLQRAFITAPLQLVNTPLTNEEKVDLVEYDENIILLKTITERERLLVLTDLYYPDWKVFVDGYPRNIIQTDYFFRGVVVPEGIHTVEFKI